MIEKIFSKWFLISLLVICVCVVMGIRVSSMSDLVSNVFGFVHNGTFPLQELLVGNPLEIGLKIAVLPVSTLVWIFMVITRFRFE